MTTTDKKKKRSIVDIAKGFGQGIWTNKYDILAMLAWPLAFLVIGGLLAKVNYGPLFIFVNIFYTLAVAAICVHAPWTFMSIAAPATWGRFINKRWEIAWSVLGADKGTVVIDGEEVAASTLSEQLKSVMKVYLVLVAIMALISTAVFLGTPVASPADEGMSPTIELE